MEQGLKNELGIEEDKEDDKLGKDKAVPLQVLRDPEGSRKLKLPDFVTTAQDGGKLSILRAGRLYLQQMRLVLVSVRG